MIKLLKKQKGITLIALVITIIVLIILAAVSISMLTGENGILTKANEAKESMERANILEEIQIKVFSKQAETGKTQITKEDMEEILEQYGTLIYEEDGTTLKGITTSKGNYEILLTEVYKGISLIEGETEIPTGPVMNPETGLTEIENPTEGTSIQFTKAYGVIEVAFLDTSNNVISNPIELTTTDLQGLIPVKWSALSAGIESTTTVDDTDWYSYIKQTSNTDGRTSKWANAKSSNDNAYFVWMPRYAYKIIYFDSAISKANYKIGLENYTILGYSTINGMIDITSGTPKLVEGTTPVNVTGIVQTSGYKDYIPHPAFEFDGAKKGIWVGKYESSGNTSTVTIKPDVQSLISQKISTFYTAALGVKTTYGLTGDSHLIRNTEWGAVTYLTDSRYGRNGTEVTINNSPYYTGRAGGTVSASYVVNGTYTYNTLGGVLASTTGNIYGIYDMSGGALEYVSGYVNNGNSSLTTNGVHLVNSQSKYKDIYSIGISDNMDNNYEKNKNIYGDAVYETTISVDSPYTNSWNSDYSYFPASGNPFFVRGGGYGSTDYAGIFACRQSDGAANYGGGFRVNLVI